MGGTSPRFVRDPPPDSSGLKAPGGGGGIGGGFRGGGRLGGGGGEVQVGRFRVGGGGAQATDTSPCPPSNQTITIHLTRTFAVTHASHVDWAEQDPPDFIHGCFCHIIAFHFGPQHSL